MTIEQRRIRLLTEHKSDGTHNFPTGTFNPTIIGTTTAGTGTYSIQVGIYTKVGNWVLVYIYLAWSAHTGTGNMRIEGLPFTSSATTNVNPALAYYNSSIALTASNVMQIVVATNSTQISIQQYPVGGGGATNVAMDTAGQIIATGQYLL